MNEDVVVIYHANCYDGVTAAWVAHKKFGFGAQYVPMNYSDDLLLGLRNKHVVFVDFCLKRGTMELIASQARTLTVLDHHKTAEKELEGFGNKPNDHVTVVFDMERSGAGIAWDYFFGFATRPNLVNYVEDRDLWKYVLTDSRIINAYIQSYDIDLAVWIDTWKTGEMGERNESPYQEGQALLRQQSKLVKSICEHAHRKFLPPVDNPTRQACDTWAQMGLDESLGVYVQTSILMSEVCEQMLKDFPDAPYSFYSFDRKDGKTQYGLRSRTGSDVDVSEIAKLYGGGGHKHAAGFEL